MITQNELRRKVVHISLGTALSLLYGMGILTRGRFLVLLGLVIFMFLLYLVWNIPVLHQFMLLVEREEDMKSFPGIGAIFFVAGFTLAAWLFPQDAALAAMLILSWADGVSVVAGAFGRVPYVNPKKNWEGIIAGIFAGGAAALVAVPAIESFLAAALAMLVEGFDVTIAGWRVSDNITVPLISGTVIVGLRALI
ncbi:MAG TPA: hypothetical protein VJH88_01605 [Candidatus Nanoarchaeia archaeon]|nr:hypothetical protein [Candidatus Nanoarchaeia archaeon]